MKLLKIIANSGRIYILDDKSKTVDKTLKIYRGDNIQLIRIKNSDDITPLFCDDIQTIAYKDIKEVITPIEMEINIFLSLKNHEELSEEQKEFLKKEYVIEKL
jgi:hypothetical protein